MGFEVPMCFRMDCALAPLREVVPMAFFFAHDVEVLRLTVHWVPNYKCIWIKPYRAQRSLPQRKKAAAEDYESEAAAACADAAAATDVSDDSEQSMPQNHSAANHTHTAWQNEHFILTAGRALQSSAAPAARRPWCPAIMAMTEQSLTR